jgi:hypothetical protein
MTTPSNTFLTTGGSPLVGMREDLSDIISQIDPEEVPFTTWAGSGEATNDLAHEWQTLALIAPTKIAWAEGDQFEATAPRRTTRLKNTCQILGDVASVSGTSQVVKKAGRQDELDFQMMIKATELRRHREYNPFLANQDWKQTDPREAAGVLTYAGSANVGAGGTEPTADGDTEYVAGTTHILNTDVWDTLVQEMWIKGARPDTAMMHPTQKRIFDKMATDENLAENQVNIRGGDGVEFITTVSIYKGAFGAIKLMMNQWMGEDQILIFDGRQQFRPKICPLPGRDWVPGNPQLNHDGKSQAIIWEGTLEVPNPNAIGFFAGLDTNVPS